jgi:hypothetical protein
MPEPPKQEPITLRRHTRVPNHNFELNYFWTRITRLLELGELEELKPMRCKDLRGRRPLTKSTGISTLGASVMR